MLEGSYLVYYITRQIFVTLHMIIRLINCRSEYKEFSGNQYVCSHILVLYVPLCKFIIRGKYISGYYFLYFTCTCHLQKYCCIAMDENYDTGTQTGVFRK